MNGVPQLVLPASHAVECFREAPLRSRRQIWCFAHAGAGAAEFAAWSAMAGPDVIICAVRLPGRERRLAEPPVTDMADIVPALAAELSPLICQGAIFYGQCLGAFLAFEVAAELGRIGGVPRERVFVASQVAPQHQAADTHISHYDDRRFRQAVKDLGGLPSGVEDDDEVWDLIEPTLRADFRLAENYAPTASPIGVPITALVGSQDRVISLDAVRGWREHTSAGFDIEMIPGDHLLSRSSGSEVLKAVQRRRAAGASPHNAEQANGSRQQI